MTITPRPSRRVGRAVRLCAVLAPATVLSTGCTVGSGRSETTTRDVAAFEQVVLRTSGDVTIDLTGTSSVTITADDNVLPLLTTQVTDGRLELGSRGSFNSRSAVKYSITAATLTGVEITGSGNVLVTGLSSGPFSAVVSGSGTIEPAGTCDVLTVKISGSGDVKGENLACATGRVSVSGSGSAAVDVSDQLDATISGSGDITYNGDPQVNPDVSGSGRISRR